MDFSSPQEQEEAEFNLGRATEAQNCLTEAAAEAARRSSLIEETGSGPILLTVSAPYYCKATDGYAGQQVVAHIRFATRDLAKANIANVAEWPLEDDLTFRITPPEAAPVADDASGEIPF